MSLDLRNDRDSPDVLSTAEAYLAADLSVIPIRPDGKKAPALPGGHDVLNRRRRASPADLQTWFGHGNKGIGIQCGAPSVGLEVLDFEFEDYWAHWSELVGAEDWALLQQLPVVRTPGKQEGQPGRHVYYRCQAAGPGQKLATISREEAQQRTGDPGQTTAIELRGEGQYVLAPGCPPACHSSGRTYEHVGGPLITVVPTITSEQRQLLLDAACSLNAHCPSEGASPSATQDRGRPGDLFNASGPSWAELLEPHDWSLARQSAGVCYWRRPGKREGWSATTGRCSNSAGHELLYVFSTNAEPFESEQAYTKFRAYALLNHAGDFSAAARALAQQGYGEFGQALAPDPQAVLARLTQQNDSPSNPDCAPSIN